MNRATVRGPDLAKSSAQAKPREIVRAASAAARLEEAARWLAAAGKTARVLLVGGSPEAAPQLARSSSLALGGSYGWERTTLGRLAGTLAAPILASRSAGADVQAGPATVEALAARVVHRLVSSGRGLGRFEAIADRPGLARAAARTLEELRLGASGPERLARLAEVDPDLDGLRLAYEEELARARIADRAAVYDAAIEAVRASSHAFIGLPLLLLDVGLAHARERDLVAAVARAAPRVLCTVPEGDDRSLAFLEAALEVQSRVLTSSARPLSRLQDGLFADPRGEPAVASEALEVLSAPGESRECVEIARRIRREAEAGLPFDRMAIALRSPVAYRSHLLEALRRAGIPAHFARGTQRPDPSGRALLALLACASEKLSARRFAEYLSLGEVPDTGLLGAPPAAAPRSALWAPPDEELVPERILRDEAPLARDAATLPGAGPVGDVESRAVVGGSLRVPFRWEQLLVDAAVIGGRERWARRLEGLRGQLEARAAAADPADPAADRARRALADLTSLRDFALPLLDELEALPAGGTWRAWIDALGALATRALRSPERVLAVLAELEPMAEVGPVDAFEVRLALERRLTDLVEPPPKRRFGCVYVAQIDALRGLSFDVVFIPGLAERVFPQKVVEDPLLPDAKRVLLDRPDGARLVVNADRSRAERLALRIAVGAATTRVVFSYPRLDLEQARPRTPSFYALELLRAGEGRLPGFGELARRAEQSGGARIGWPAPARAEDAVDEAEHDLALLEQVLRLPEADGTGMARYLLSANPHLARALRFRASRWTTTWNRADGLMVQAPRKGPGDAAYQEARAALDRHALAARSFSPTALQNFAACPYRFVLQAIHRLTPREEPAAIEELDPLERGSLVHEVQFELYGRLRDEGLLPLSLGEPYERARRILDRTLAEVAERFEERLAPAIAQVWQDGLRSIAADLREMLRLLAEDAQIREWKPVHFELSFGPLPDRGGKDPLSVDEPVEVAGGLRLRGSIDLIEEHVTTRELRATDYKTGKARAKEGDVIGGGETLQPVFYALVLEKMFPGRAVQGGRLWYCTAAGGFKGVPVELDRGARESAELVVTVIGNAIKRGVLPAAPDPKGYGCEYCDYLRVCGPYEVSRTGRKVGPLLEALTTLRRKK